MAEVLGKVELLGWDARTWWLRYGSMYCSEPKAPVSAAAEKEFRSEGP